METRIARHKTALTRYSLSRPFALAITQGIVTKSTTVFDYGCGRGADVRILRRRGFDAHGWDPHYSAHETIHPSDCVNLGYVLNVIEDPKERLSVLERAFELTSKVLIVSVRVDQSLTEAAEYSDGLITKVGSFQKLYSQQEFRDYIQSSLGRRPYFASLGIAYIFKDEQLESEFIARSSISRPQSFRESLIHDFSKDRIGKRYLSLSKALGRAPLTGEFRDFAKLIERFGPQQRIERIAFSILDPSLIAATRERKKEMILMYFAMMRLQGLKPPPIRMLPEEVQADIKMIWTSYPRAIESSTEFLFQLGKPELIRKHCEASVVGKRLPEDLYVHKSAESQIPTVLSLLVFAARQVVGELDYDLIKISLDGRKVSFLKYREFEEVAHPELIYSVRVYLPTSAYTIRDYSNSDNPPILHRKETFLDPLHPRFAEYSSLTAKEDQEGLLSRPDIGTRSGWKALLASRNIEITGHSLRSVPDSEPSPTPATLS